MGIKYTSILILRLIYLLLVFSSCRQSGNHKTKVLSDSLIKATEDIAIGDADFGISEKEFNLFFPDSLVNLDGNIHIISSYFDSSGRLNKVYFIDKATFHNQ